MKGGDRGRWLPTAPWLNTVASAFVVNGFEDRQHFSISNIQALRAFAALAVVFYHTAYLINGVHTDFEGVAVFFILSGFLMTLITRRTAEHFMRDRLIRIVPLYWLMTLASLVWFGFAIVNPIVLGQLVIATSHGGPPALWQLFCAFGGNIFNLDTAKRTVSSLLFLPLDLPVLGVGWTLNLEMFYYFVFWCALLAIGKRFAPLAVVLFLAALCVLSNFAPIGFIRTYGGSYTPFFIIGVCTYYIWVAVSKIVLKIKHLKVILTLAFLLYVGVNASLPNLLYSTLIRYTLPYAAVTSVLIAHTNSMRVSNRWVLLMGDASYALYLSHTLVAPAISNVSPSWLAPDKSLLGVMLVIIACSLIAVALHLLVERPTIHGLKKLARISPPVGPAAPIVPTERSHV